MSPKKTGRLTLQLDELWSFVGCKENKQWLWLAMDVDTREIVGVYLGDRTVDTPQPKGVGILASTGESRKHGTKSRYFPRSQNRSASFFGDSPSLLRSN